jgi:hypothetical protein
VLTGDEVDRQSGLTQQLLRKVELFGLGEMRDVSGMDDEVRLLRQGLDLRDRFPERADRIGIGRLGGK